MSYTIRQADISNDKDAIINFWNNNNTNKLDNKYAWIYESNPDGQAETWIITLSESREIIGMASIFPRKFSFDGAVIKAGIQGDFFIHSNHRTFGPALALIRAVANSIVGSDYDFYYGFPNDKSEAILIRAGYIYLGNMCKYTRLFNINRLLHEKLSLPLGLLDPLKPILSNLLNLIYPDFWIFNYGRYTTEISRTIDSRIDDLLIEFQTTCCTTVKSRPYLNWKYAGDPDDENFFFSMYDTTGSMRGCIVFRIENGNQFEMREILYTNNQLQLFDCLALFFKYAKSQNAEYAYAHTLNKCNFLKQTTDLFMTNAGEGRGVYLILNPDKERHAMNMQRIHSSSFCLLKTDQDT